MADISFLGIDGQQPLVQDRQQIVSREPIKRLHIPLDGTRNLPDDLTERAQFGQFCGTIGHVKGVSDAHESGPVQTHKL